MAAPFHFEHSLLFEPDHASEILRTIPTLPGVFALYGPPQSESQAEAQPYLTRAAQLRRRIARILAPPELSADGRPAQSKRLNLRQRVVRIDYTITGSDFESTLTLYHASAAVFGLDEARRRLKLRTPFFLRFTAENAYPRVYSTNRLSKRALDNFFGPFPSRAAADRYCDAVLDLFKLRRCFEDLAPYPEHPGCVYGEMNKCLAPCNQACTPAGAAAYAAEAAAVHAFFATHGESMLAPIVAERELASAELDFERAAELHAQSQKVKAAAALADPLVQPIPQLRAIIVQRAAKPASDSDSTTPGELGAPVAAQSQDSQFTSAEPAAALFLLHSGCLTGPARLSTLGVRAVKQQTSVGSSLFAQPLMLQAVPLADESQPATESGAPRLAPETWVAATESPTLNPEARTSALIAALEGKASAPTDLTTLSDHLSLLRRWYYRPEKQRTGELFLPKAEPSREDAPGKTAWPIRRILNGAARAALGEPAPMADTNRDLAQRNPDQPNPDNAEQQPTPTRTLHAGRPDVEREVPILPKPPAFKSRRKLN